MDLKANDFVEDEEAALAAGTDPEQLKVMPAMSPFDVDAIILKVPSCYAYDYSRHVGGIEEKGSNGHGLQRGGENTKPRLPCASHTARFVIQLKTPFWFAGVGE